MTDQIEDSILANSGAQWRKTAMVIAETLEALRLAPTDANAELLGARVTALVQAGVLESRGDTRRWRRSEVRLTLRSPDEGGTTAPAAGSG